MNINVLGAPEPRPNLNDEKSNATSLQPIVPILDENIHSPASVLARCPFLFTVSAYLPSHIAFPLARSKDPC